VNPRVLFLAALLLAGCGLPEDPTRGGFAFSLALAPAAADDTAGLQVAILKGISAHPCEELENVCLSTNPTVTAADFVRLYEEGSGQERRAIRIPLSADATTGQDLTFLAEVGTDYRVVVEALSRDAVPRLVGTSCTPLREGVRQAGASLPANPLVIYSPYLACDPRIDP